MKLRYECVYNNSVARKTAVRMLLVIICLITASRAGPSECNIQSTQRMTHLPVQCRKVLLSGAKLGDKAAHRLAHLLTTYSQVTEVDLRNNLITDDGAAALARALGGNVQGKGSDRVVNVRLAHNLIGSAGAKALGNALATNEGLVELDLSYNHIKPAGGRSIAAGLAANKHTSLRTLILDGCDIGDQGAGAIAAAMLHSPSLRTSLYTLSMQKAGVMALGASKLAAAVAIRSSQLRTLDLSNNKGLGDRGAVKIFEALLTNKHLRNLVLASCSISEMAVGVLGTALATNTRLNTLSLADNKLLSEGGSLIGTALAHNRGLLSLDANKAS